MRQLTQPDVTAQAATERFGHLATGSWPEGNPGWIDRAIRAQLPKLAFALGDSFADFLDASDEFPAWCGELAALERARLDIAEVRTPIPLMRRDLTIDRSLRVVPHAQLTLTTTANDLWSEIDHEEPLSAPRVLAWPRLVVVWRTHGVGVRDRIIPPDEAAAFRLAQAGTSIGALAARFGGRNPHARAVDVVLGWVDDRLLY
jgi:hypothetical protein